MTGSCGVGDTKESILLQNIDIANQDLKIENCGRFCKDPCHLYKKVFFAEKAISSCTSIVARIWSVFRGGGKESNKKGDFDYGVGDTNQAFPGFLCGGGVGHTFPPEAIMARSCATPAQGALWYTLARARCTLSLSCDFDS